MNGYKGQGGYNGLISAMVGEDDATAIDTLNQRTLDTLAASDQYNADTQHGATQGAILNTSIT